jgi:group I intron endonuclease
LIVYKATNLVNGKVYIGKTVRDLSHAKARHHQRAKFMWKYGVISRFYSAIRKHGFSNFVWTIEYKGKSDQDIQAREREYIAKFNSMDSNHGYNMTPGGDGGAGRTLSAQQISRLREIFTGRNNPQYGKFGESHPAFGNKHTPEAKAKISSAHKGKKASIETRRKLSATRIAMFAESKKQRQAWNEQQRVARRKAVALKKAAGGFRGENAGPSKISDLERALICQRRHKGESYASIAKDFPLVLTGIRAICEDWGPLNGFPFNRLVAKRKSKLSDQDKVEICKAYQGGLKMGPLSKKFNVRETTIHTVLRVWGPVNGF